MFPQFRSTLKSVFLSTLTYERYQRYHTNVYVRNRPPYIIVKYIFRSKRLSLFSLYNAIHELRHNVFATLQLMTILFLEDLMLHVESKYRNDSNIDTNIGTDGVIQIRLNRMRSEKLIDKYESAGRPQK